MGERPEIFVRGPGTLLPGEEAKTAGAALAIRQVLPAIAERFGGIATMNALMSIWLDSNIRLAGVDDTEKSLRLLRRDVKRFDAAIRAAKTEPQGSA